jgi:hypothetical protein
LRKACEIEVITNAPSGAIIGIFDPSVKIITFDGTLKEAKVIILS